MKNKIRFLAMMLIGVLLSVNQVWGAQTMKRSTGQTMLKAAMNTEETCTLIAPAESNNTYQKFDLEDECENTWKCYATRSKVTEGGKDYGYLGLNKNSNGYHIESPEFPGNITSVNVWVKNASTTQARTVYLCSSNTTAQPTSGDLGSVSVAKGDDDEYSVTLAGTEFNKFYLYVSAALSFNYIEVTYEEGSSTTYTLYLPTTTYCTGDAQGSFTSNKGTATAGTGYYSGMTAYTGITAGTEVTLTALPSSGYTFTGWEEYILVDDESNDVPVAGSGNTGTFAMPSSNCVIWTCAFEEAHVVTYTDLFAGHKSGHFQPSFLALSQIVIWGFFAFFVKKFSIYDAWRVHGGCTEDHVLLPNLSSLPLAHFLHNPHFSHLQRFCALYL